MVVHRRHPKLYTKAFFARRGQTATFMAQLSEDFPGLSGNLSLSLWDDGRQTSRWMLVGAALVAG
jgi:hypothetical protein